MEGEAVRSTRIGFLLILISTLVFIVIVLVWTTRGYLADSTTRIINVTNLEREKQFEDYDRKWMSGTKVLRAIRLYEGNDFGIVYATVSTQVPGDYAVNLGGIYQNAVLDVKGYYRIPSFSTWKSGSKIDNSFYRKNFQKDASGRLLKNENKAFTRHLAADTEYIQPDGRFYAELIKDITDATIGICFTQK